MHDVKAESARRAMGHRTSPRVHSARLRQAPQRENGAQRAARRAAEHGLTVGAPVRAFIGAGRPRPNGNGHPGRPTPQKPLVPLERIDRLARYLLQRDVTTHGRHGIGWTPTPRQRRRLDKKQQQASWRALLASQSLRAQHALEHGDAYYAAMSEPFDVEPVRVAEPEPRRVPMFAQRANAAADAMAEQAKPRGFRIVDRRGEHR